VVTDRTAEREVTLVDELTVSRDDE
jgi:hypothetical protein